MPPRLQLAGRGQRGCAACDPGAAPGRSCPHGCSSPEPGRGHDHSLPWRPIAYRTRTTSRSSRRHGPSPLSPLLLFINSELLGCNLYMFECLLASAPMKSIMNQIELFNAVELGDARERCVLPPRRRAQEPVHLIDAPIQEERERKKSYKRE